ncbi:MAG: signal peptidase II [Defluviitaleaceae bacterium]|nr:signal peptidase II [Defluviitaleaceae bacterium]
MKKLFCVSVVLIVLDQITKHLARYFFADGLVVIIPGILSIAPFHNTYLGWLGWWAGIVDVPSPFILIFLKHLLILLFLMVMYWYFCYISEKNRFLLKASIVPAVSGIGGSFIDNLLFNGSWDFIFVFNALIFDLKDFYLLAHLILLIIFSVLLVPQYLKLSERQRRQLSFFSWIQNRCKAPNLSQSTMQGVCRRLLRRLN